MHANICANAFKQKINEQTKQTKQGNKKKMFRVQIKIKAKKDKVMGEKGKQKEKKYRPELVHIFTTDDER